MEKRYPDGALWILNRAKILRMTLDPEGAIRVLKEGLREGRERSFKQADMMVRLPFSMLGLLCWHLGSVRDLDATVPLGSVQDVDVALRLGVVQDVVLEEC